MCEELKCKVCGKLASDDDHFYKTAKLCNRHMRQLKTYGYYLDNDCKNNPPRRIWTEEEKKKICDMYNSNVNMVDIEKEMKCSGGAVRKILKECGVPKTVRNKNDHDYIAPYHDYNWCYERYVIERMTTEEMAEECGCSVKTMRKWCSGKHHLNYRTLRKELHLTQIQKELIMFSRLGDGHIEKTDTQPIFKVLHAINQKDYLFWKYEILKNVCNRPPRLHTNVETVINGVRYKCQDTYCFNTKILDDLYPIREMTKSEIILNLNEFGLSIHFLDDGRRRSDGFWELCYAGLTTDERELYCKVLRERFGINPHIRKNEIDIGFTKNDSKIIDEIILRNIPNDLDVVQYKILKDDDYAKVC